MQPTRSSKDRSNQLAFAAIRTIWKWLPRLTSTLKFREKALDRLPVAYFRADRRIGNGLLVRRPSKQLAGSGPVECGASAGGIEPSRRTHSSLRSTHRTVARDLRGSHLDCIQGAGRIALCPLR